METEGLEEGVIDTLDDGDIDDDGVGDELGRMEQNEIRFPPSIEGFGAQT